MMGVRSFVNFYNVKSNLRWMNMLSQRGSHTKRHFYILAVLIPLLLVSALFVLIGIAPFGSHKSVGQRPFHAVFAVLC